ncbi:MAG TPA: hypothetical protein VD978_00790 [Azospirillum sp.]|nr:hypothetical protein [Azospirillum sp.]
MMRFAPAATLALAAAVLAPVSVSAQTVPDFQAAMAAVPSAPPAAIAQACLPLQNYVLTSFGPGEEKGPWLLSWLPFTPFSDNPELAARRQDCEAVRQQPVIAFNQGSAEQIVTPPVLEPEDRLTRPVEPPADQQLPGYDSPRRTGPQMR